MFGKFIAILRLSRPWLLLDGIVMFALGAMIARYEGYALMPQRYALGQLFVSALQLMAHYLNEYWDVDADRRSRARTWFSGGSGVLPEKRLARETVFALAMASLALGLAAGALLTLQNALAPAAWIMMGLIFFALFFWSAPPVTLINTGYGELVISITFAGLIPAFSHFLMAGGTSWLIVTATAPLALMHLAMLIAFSLPDQASDEASGKRTLLVRLGTLNGASLHNALLAASLALYALGSFVGLPRQVAISAAIVAPLVVWQIVTMRRVRQGEPVSVRPLTFVAALVFGLSAYLTAFGFWVIG